MMDPTPPSTPMSNNGAHGFHNPFDATADASTVAQGEHPMLTRAQRARNQAAASRKRKAGDDDDLDEIIANGDTAERFKEPLLRRARLAIDRGFFQAANRTLRALGSLLPTITITATQEPQQQQRLVVPERLVSSDETKVTELLSSFVFFQRVSASMDVPIPAKCVDEASELYARVLRLSTEWHGLPLTSVKLAVLYLVVRDLPRRLTHEDVVKAGLKCVDSSIAGVSPMLVREATLLIFDKRVEGIPTITMQAHAAKIAKSLPTWSSWDVASVVRVARVATALGVTASQNEIVAAAFATVSATLRADKEKVSVTKMSKSYSLKERAVTSAVDQIVERGVLQFCAITKQL